MARFLQQPLALVRIFPFHIDRNDRAGFIQGSHFVDQRVANHDVVDTMPLQDFPELIRNRFSGGAGTRPL